MSEHLTDKPFALTDYSFDKDGNIIGIKSKTAEERKIQKEKTSVVFDGDLRETAESKLCLAVTNASELKKVCVIYRDKEYKCTKEYIQCVIIAYYLGLANILLDIFKIWYVRKTGIRKELYNSIVIRFFESSNPDIVNKEINGDESGITYDDLITMLAARNGIAHGYFKGTTINDIVEDKIMPVCMYYGDLVDEIMKLFESNNMLELTFSKLHIRRND